jgi:two-component system sensor histidine kinase UhpB
MVAQIQSENQQLHRLNKKLIESQERESKLISQELHDEIGQALTAMSFNLAAIKADLTPEIDTIVSTRIQETKTLIEQTVQHIRILTLRLYPSMLDDLGLVPALRWYTDQFSKKTQIETLLEVSDFNTRMSPDIELTLYRIAVELLANVARHSQASRTILSLHHEAENIHITIKDNGVGFAMVADDESGLHMGGIGLFEVKERASLLGGKVVINSNLGQGTQVVIDIPWRKH